MNTLFELSQQIGLRLIPLLTSKRAAGVAGAAFLVLAATLASSGSIPVISITLFLDIDRLTSEWLVPVKLIGIAVATIVAAKWRNALDMAKLQVALNGVATADEMRGTRPYQPAPFQNHQFCELSSATIGFCGFG